MKLYTPKQLIKLVEESGWNYEGHNGSHAIYRRSGFNHINIVTTQTICSRHVISTVLRTLLDAEHQEGKRYTQLSVEIIELEVTNRLENEHKRKIDALNRKHEALILAQRQEQEAKIEEAKLIAELEKDSLQQNIDRMKSTISEIKGRSNSIDDYEGQLDEYFRKSIEEIEEELAKNRDEKLRLEKSREDIELRERKIKRRAERLKQERTTNEEWVIQREEELRKQEDEIKGLRIAAERELDTIENSKRLLRHSLGNEFVENLEQVHASLASNLPSPPSINVYVPTESFEELNLLQPYKQFTALSAKQLFRIILFVAVVPTIFYIAQLSIPVIGQMILLIPLVGFVIFALNCFEDLSRQIDYLQKQMQICESLQAKIFKSYENLSEIRRDFKDQENRYRENIENWFDECWSISLNLVRKIVEQSQDYFSE